jgi:hypothetical protein
MNPAKVGDGTIRQLIRELSANGRPPSGVVVRRALQDRYGSRGGVRRIYRLLSAEVAVIQGAPTSSVNARLLEQEVRNLREQLKQLRQREDAQQVYWTREVGQLRQQVQALESAPGRSADGADLSAPVRQAEIRAGQLEVMVRTFGPAAGRGQGER